jgi:ParB-like chromosome segregation protein Spo0J
MITQMGFHSMANLFPLMEDEEFNALVDDIRQHGQHEPIWTYEGQIVDGRNRYRACLELGIEPTTQEWCGASSVMEFALSQNLHRRHLTSSQRAVIALQVEKHLASEAKKRQGTRTDISQKIDESYGRADEQVAALVGTNRQYVSDARRVRQTAPDLLPDVRDGKITIPDAKELAHFPEEFRKKALEEIHAGSPVKDVLKTANANAKERRKKRKEESLKSLGSLRREILGEELASEMVDFERAQEWEKALARSFVLTRDAPQLLDASQLTQRWEKVEKKQIRLRWIREIQKKIEPIAAALEKEIAELDEYNAQEFEEYFRKEMSDFDPNGF